MQVGHNLLRPESNEIVAYLMFSLSCLFVILVIFGAEVDLAHAMEVAFVSRICFCHYPLIEYRGRHIGRIKILD